MNCGRCAKRSGGGSSSSETAKVRKRLRSRSIGAERIDKLLWEIPPINNGRRMEAYESASGTLDDEKAQTLAETQDKRRQNALAHGQSGFLPICALEGWITSNGRMMEAE